MSSPENATAEQYDACDPIDIRMTIEALREGKVLNHLTTVCDSAEAMNERVGLLTGSDQADRLTEYQSNIRYFFVCIA
jgi:hypothetical protein